MQYHNTFVVPGSVDPHITKDIVEHARQVKQCLSLLVSIKLLQQVEHGQVSNKHLKPTSPIENSIQGHIEFIVSIKPRPVMVPLFALPFLPL